MFQFICLNCGSQEYIEEGRFIKCTYCGTRFKKQNKDGFSQGVTIDLTDDVSRLLEMCKKEPQKIIRYANLILEIDPYNKQAKKYLGEV